MLTFVKVRLRGSCCERGPPSPARTGAAGLAPFAQSPRMKSTTPGQRREVFLTQRLSLCERLSSFVRCKKDSGGVPFACECTSLRQTRKTSVSQNGAPTGRERLGSAASPNAAADHNHDTDEPARLPKAAAELKSMPCRLPGCSRVVVRRSEEQGRHGAFCCRRHRQRFARDAARLDDWIEQALKRASTAARVAELRRTDRDLRFLLMVRSAYVDPQDFLEQQLPTATQPTEAVQTLNKYLNRWLAAKRGGSVCRRCKGTGRGIQIPYHMHEQLARIQVLDELDRLAMTFVRVEYFELLANLRRDWNLTGGTDD